MRRMVIGILILITLGVLGCGVFPGKGWAAHSCEDWVVKIASVQGIVEAQNPGEKQWQPVELDDTYCSGVAVRTGEHSRAAVVFRGENMLRLHENTAITFSVEEKQQASFLDLLNGIVHFFSRTSHTLQVNTPYVNAMVEGTEFLVAVASGQTLVTTYEGRVAVGNDFGRLTVAAGQSAVTHAGQPPAYHTVVHPRDAVSWALYYPQVLTPTPADFPDPDSEWQNKVRQSVAFYWIGDLAGAFESLSGLPEEAARDPRFLTYRAVLLLTVGNAGAARTDLEKVLELVPGNARALALESIVALVQNRGDEALRLAEKAVEADPRSPGARIALSYAQQARFNLPGALETLKEAVRLDPTDALARARLAEMWLSLGNLDHALEAARRAVALNPRISRTQSVLGFAYLAQVKTGEAKAAFRKAIGLDQADPLARLGLGLAIIRDGDLEEGRREIETAVILDPNNSLIRSYLGKAYFDERRAKQAQEQFEIAKALDPLDPTPWFYDAIEKLTVNRPVEALQDLQKSIALNDNRAVYRSRLLLDQDLAARSASLARIYSELGFDQFALVEGWRSVDASPSDYSAHRFLADSYAALPRHEVARVSELLQSQLLQPLNITPVQPLLAVSDPFILEGAGPSDLSFNEFNPLFNRNRAALEVSGIMGEKGTYSDEAVQSSVWGRYSYSIGQMHYQTEGFRKNNDLTQDIYNAFVQTSLSYKTSVQAEFTSTDSTKGDLPLRFDPNFYYPDFREKDERDRFRVGLHHAFSPSSDLLVSFMYGTQDADDYIMKSPKLDITVEQEGYLGEIQHIFKSNRFDLISGAGYFDGNRSMETYFMDLPGEPEKTDLDHADLYTYSHIHYPNSFTWTLGVSADFFEGIVDRDQVNPKLGMMWNLFPSTTLRAAGFRVLKRTLLSDQTLEPTEVAGFNQFFDDPEGTEAWRYGVGIDQKFTDSIYGGAEFSRRDLDVPYERQSSLETLRADWEESFARGYLYWAPMKWLGLSAEYQFERLERTNDSLYDAILEADTHRVPLGLNFFHPSGLIVRLRGTYVYQDGEFVDSQQNLSPGSDHFWVFDASLGYRLPKRYGIVSLEVRNLLDEAFLFQDTDPASPLIIPGRLILGKFTFAF